MPNLIEAYEAELAAQMPSDPTDAPRLSRQLEAVKAAMSDGQWHTLEELAGVCGGSVPGVSARVRDLRKVRFGAHQIERKNCGGGLYQYRMVV